MAVSPLEALVEAGHEVSLVVTGVDKRRGRGSETSPTPVKSAAERLHIPVSHNVDDVVAADAELGVVVAFGQIIKPALLAALDMVNLHFSLLPRWRGAAPVERAMLAGDRVTGVCLMALEEGLDTGGVFARGYVPIDDHITRAALGTRLVEVGSQLMTEALERGLGEPEPQVGDSTYAAKILQNDLRIEWGQPAEAANRVVRVGGAWTTFRGERVKIHEAEVVEDALIPTIVQAAGKPRMSFAAWRNGAKPETGEWFE
jgi:methionyl-tRNA formyltransferase